MTESILYLQVSLILKAMSISPTQQIETQQIRVKPKNEIASVSDDIVPSTGESSQSASDIAVEYTEERYRWVIIALVSLCFAINNIANNAIIPIASKIIAVYNLNETYANLPIQIGFLINPIMNFTCGSIVDREGLGLSFRIGAVLYAVGMFGFVLINYGYFYVLIGAVLISIGQPLIMNSPAKVACFWFCNRNVTLGKTQRTFATGVINAINIVTLGVSLVLPAIFVNEDSYGDQAKEEIFSLYSKYFVVGVANCILVMLFMREKPERAPSAGAEQQKSNFSETLEIIKADRNLWRFFGAAVILLGTFLSFGSTSNLLFKPFGYEDTQIAAFGVSLLVSGIIGSVVYTYYIKKTLQYRRVSIFACTTAVVFISTVAFLMNIMPEQRLLITLMILGMGFNLIPMVPISHDLGCELAFPVGEAQVVGIMTGVAMLYTVVLTLSITSIVGFGTTAQSAINMIIYISLFAVGSFLYGTVEIDLKRRQMEQGHQNPSEFNPREGNELDEVDAEISKNSNSGLTPLNLAKKSNSQTEDQLVDDSQVRPLTKRSKENKK